MTYSVTSVTVCILCDDQRIRVSATENHRIFNTRSSAKLQTTGYKTLSFLSWGTCKLTELYLRMKRFIDRSVGAYFSLAHPVHTITYIMSHQNVYYFSGVGFQPDSRTPGMLSIGICRTPSRKHVRPG